jgi:GAF domain-containing protein
MPKKRLFSRLDRLFTDIDQDKISPPDPSIQQTSEWTGQCDANGSYISCNDVPPDSLADLSPVPSPHNIQPYKPLPTAEFTPENPNLPVPNSLAEKPWSQAALQSLETNRQTMQIPRDQSPAALAVPFQFGLEGRGVLEILDDSGVRHTWTEEERLLVQEVANQLALALENARLYEAIQQELAERKRAEAEILRRSQDLAALNQIGQELSRLVRQKEILEVLQNTINRLVDGRNIIIALLDSVRKAIYYPIYIRGGQMQANPDLETTGAVVKHILEHRTPLLINGRVFETFATRGLEFSGRSPAALLAIPMIAGDRPVGAIILENYESETAFTENHLELLSTVASQTTIALENARLFEEIRKALTSIEHRERHQSSVARAVAALTEFGSQALPDVLEMLGRGANANRVYYAETIEEERGYYWTSIEKWVDSEQASQFVNPSLQKIPVDQYPFWSNSLIDKGWVAGNTLDFPVPERILLKSRGVRSSLMIAVPGKARTPGFIAFDHTDTNRRWQNDEISILQVAADALANTLERQHLLEEARRRALELQAAAEVARDTSSTLSLDILLDRIVNQIITRFKYYQASIFLKEETGNYALIRESTGLAGQMLKERGFKLACDSKSIIGEVLTTGQAVTVNDVTRSDIYFPTPLLPDTRSEMGLPLKLGERILGVLDIQSTERMPFNNDDTAVLQILADQIAVAIDNARSYELVQQAVEDMREVDRMKSQFLANMSHELRTPLNSIIGFSKVILKGIDGPINEIQEQDLTAIYNSGQHLLNLINDVLDLSKIEAGKMELSFAELDLNDMVRSVMSTATGLVKDKPIELSFSIPDNLPSLHADSTRVRQVLLNFLSNAAKFTEEGSIVIGAGVTTSPSGQSEVIVTVSDTGPGIAEGR